MSPRGERRGVFERPGVIRALVAALCLVCVGLLAAEFFYPHHPHFTIDGWFGFYPIIGFVAYCFIVLSAKALRPLLRRNEDYYGEADPDEADLEDSIGRDHD